MTKGHGCKQLLKNGMIYIDDQNLHIQSIKKDQALQYVKQFKVRTNDKTMNEIRYCR